MDHMLGEIRTRNPTSMFSWSSTSLIAMLERLIGLGNSCQIYL